VLDNVEAAVAFADPGFPDDEAAAASARYTGALTKRRENGAHDHPEVPRAGAERRPVEQGSRGPCAPVG